MLPGYVLIVDITIHSSLISYEQFREQVDPCLIRLEVLKGAFERSPSPCPIMYYPPDAQHSKHEWKDYSARGVVLISIGKQRAECLIQLYQAIVDLIVLELPNFEVTAQIDKYEFS